MPAQTEDQDMHDAPSDQDAGKPPVSKPEDEHYDPSPDRERVRVLPGATDTAASYQFDGEDHTLGNALRYIIMKNPDVEFCGYSIPHPSENKMNLRIQTYDGVSALNVLEKGLDDLMDMCDVITEKFTIARDEFDAENSRDSNE